MRGGVPEILMALAARLLGEGRRDWARAMRAEFEVARTEGEGLSFAAGCLFAAWGEMCRHAQGRNVLADYALAVGLLIPMAALQLASAFGLASAIEGPLSEGVFLPMAAPNPFVSYPQVSALPCLLVLWLLLGLSHLRLAWVLVERDWARVIQTGALIGATSLTLIMLTGTLLLDVTPVALHAAVMAVEFAALMGSARRDARLSRDPWDAAV